MKLLNVSLIDISNIYCLAAVEGKGLSFVDAPAGTFIQFACGANRTASDGLETDRNGLFTKHLLTHVTDPNEDIMQIFQSVAGDVYSESNGTQKPLSVNGLIKRGRIHLNRSIEDIPSKTHEKDRMNLRLISYSIPHKKVAPNEKS